MTIGLMDMTIEPEFGSIVDKKFFETFKALMCIVIHVAIAADWSVGDNDVDSAIFVYLTSESSDPSFHFGFTELISAFSIAK